MPMEAYLTVEGEDQGKIEGECDRVGHDGEIMVYAIEHETSIPSERQSTEATGERIHHPLTVTKKIDKSSPLLSFALTQNEKIKEAVLKFYRQSPSGDGTREHYYTIKLQSARIVSIKLDMPNMLLPQNNNLTEMEKLSLAYKTIIWIYEPSGIEHQDTWAEDETT
jgi:type VI secretion system secreted protein Hcp